MTPDQVRGLFVESGALLEGHFLLSSGLHSPRYLQCALVLARPRHAEALGRAVASIEPFERAPDLVLSPAMGGVVIGHEVGRALGSRAFFTEREGGRMTLRRGFRVEPGETVLIVEDVVTTGRSTLEAARVARAAGGRVIALRSIVDRSRGALELDAPYRSLLKMDVPAYPAAECPLCREGRPLVKPGSRPSKERTC